MTTNRTTIGAAMLLALFISAFTIASSTAAQAQCPNVTVINNTACAVSGCLVTTAGNFCFNVPAGGAVILPSPVIAYRATGIVTICGTFFPFSALAPFCTAAFNSSPAIACCTVACWDPATCTLTLNPAPAPCPC